MNFKQLLQLQDKTRLFWLRGAFKDCRSLSGYTVNKIQASKTELKITQIMCCMKTMEYKLQGGNLIVKRQGRTSRLRYGELTWQHHMNLGSFMRACSVSFLWNKSYTSGSRQSLSWKTKHDTRRRRVVIIRRKTAAGYFHTHLQSDVFWY